MIVKAHAKLNWSLDTVGLREDGYHLLDMVMQSIELHDTLTLEPSDHFSFTVDGSVRVPRSADNLVMRAAQALREYAGVQAGASIHLHKRIPVGAGLGGGSSDAAAVLKGLNALWKTDVPMETLLALGLTLGADIPYCLTGGLCRAEGIGERLTPLDNARVYHLVLIQPCRALSTAQVFSGANGDIPVRRPDTENVIIALQTGNLKLLSQSMGNALQAVSEALRPDMRAAIKALREHGARAAMMTGSGSVVYGVFASASAARVAWAALGRRYRVCHLTHTIL